MIPSQLHARLSALERHPILNEPRSSVRRAMGLTNRAAENLKSFMNEPMERSMGFDGAWYDRTSAGWVAWRSSMDAILRSSVWIICGRARDLWRNNSFVRRAVWLWQNNVVGEHGIKGKSALKNKDGTPNAEINDQINKHWAFFGMPENLTPAGDMSMVEFQRLALGCIAVDGSVLVQVIEDPKAAYGIQYRLIEFDRLDTTKFVANSDSYVEIRFGVEFDRRTGKVLAYWLYDNNPNDITVAGAGLSVSSSRVSVRDMMYVFRKERPEQTVGVSWFVACMVNIHILGAYTKAALIKSQMAASYFLFIKNTFNLESDQGADAQGMQTQPVDNGILMELKKGQEIQNVSDNSSQNTYDPLFKWTLRQIAGDLGFDFETFANDFSAATYASGRLASLETRTHYIVLQTWLSFALLRPMFARWLLVNLRSQRMLKIPDELYQDIMYAMEWVGKRWPGIDPRYEAMVIGTINSGLMTRAQYAKDHGHDIDDLIEGLAYEQKELQDAAIVIQTTSGQQAIFGQTDPTAPAKPAAGTVKPSPEDDDSGQE